jgi:hypothetical protein
MTLGFGIRLQSRCLAWQKTGSPKRDQGGLKKSIGAAAGPVKFSTQKEAIYRQFL